MSAGIIIIIIIIISSTTQLNQPFIPQVSAIYFPRFESQRPTHCLGDSHQGPSCPRNVCPSGSWNQEGLGWNLKLEVLSSLFFGAVNFRMLEFLTWEILWNSQWYPYRVIRNKLIAQRNRMSLSVREDGWRKKQDTYNKLEEVLFDPKSTHGGVLCCISCRQTPFSF